MIIDDITKEINITILAHIKTLSNNVTEYVRLFKVVFDVGEMCEILQINKNRYNYLNRHGKLDWYIAQVGGFVGGDKK